MRRKDLVAKVLLLISFFSIALSITVPGLIQARAAHRALAPVPTRHKFLTPVVAQTPQSTPTATPTPSPTQTPTPIQTPAPIVTPTPSNHKLNLDNGIVVGQTKIYDDRSLSQLLDTLQQNLAGLRFINQDAIAGGIGRFQGERQDMSSFGLNITTSPVPNVVTTTNTGTTNTFNQVTSQPSPTPGSTAPPPNVQTTVNTVTPNTTQQVTTQPQQTPAAAALPAQSSAFNPQQTTGLSGQDLLAEQVSLQYQVMDLQLLLQRSISDKVLTFNEGGATLSGRRAKVVIGFQVSVNSLDEYKNAVAEVEIELTTKSTTNTKAPSLVFLLPRDKSYNVAAVTKDAKQIGLGAILGVFNVGGSFGKSKETLYLVGQTDTVALEKIHPAEEELNPKALTISWQFRPVLGQPSIKAAPHQVFALVALPVLANEPDYKMSVRAYTRWRRYNMKSQTLGEVIKGSESYRDFDDIGPDTGAASVVLAPKISNVTWSDTGSGQVLVTVHGSNFVSGTTALVGSTVLSRPDNGLNLQDENTMLLLIPEQKLAQADNVLIVGPQGTPSEVTVDNSFNFTAKPDGVAGCKKPEGWGLKIQNVTVEPYDSQNSTVTVDLVSRNAPAGTTHKPGVYNVQVINNSCRINESPISPIAVVGNAGFGFKDVPLKRLPQAGDTSEKFSFIMPTQAIRGAGKIIVKQPFLGADYVSESPFSMPGDFTAAQIATLSSNEQTAQVAITGSGFNRCLPISVTIGKSVFYRPADAGCMVDGIPQTVIDSFVKALPSGTKNTLTLHGTTLLTLDAEQPDFKKVKQIIVEQAGAQGQMLALATPPPIPEPVIDKQDALKEGDVKDIKLTGSNFGSVEGASFEGTDLHPNPAQDGKTMTITVPSQMTQKSGDKDINVTLKNGVTKKYTLKVDKGS